MEQNQLLLIEDEKDLSDALKENLELEGIKVLQAFDGIEGMKVALAEKPRLILLDLMMPNMDGTTFLRELRTDKEYGASARVIVLSNVAEKESVDEMVRLGALDYIIKTNWSLQELTDQIKTLMV